MIKMTLEHKASGGQSQSDKFKRAACELETDVDPERFKERLRGAV
jgi:hypothetical protein